jgi:hypothetical protein
MNCANSGFPAMQQMLPFMQPAPEQMMGNRKRMGPGKAIGMLPLDHQICLGAIEPACILELGVIDHDVFIGGHGCVM